MIKINLLAEKKKTKAKSGKKKKGEGPGVLPTPDNQPA